MKKNPIVTKEKVFEAATVIASRDERPMAKQIKQEFFDSMGSLETIQNYLWQWREQHESAKGKKSLPELPAELLDIISTGLRRTIGKMTLEADERIRNAKCQSEEKLKAVSEELQAFVLETKELETVIAEKDDKIENLEAEIGIMDTAVKESREKARMMESALEEQRENTRRTEVKFDEFQEISDQKLEGYHQETISLKSELASLKAMLAEAEGGRKRAEAESQNFREQSSNYLEEVEVCKRDVASLKGRLKAVESERDRLNRQCDTLITTMATAKVGVNNKTVKN